MYRFSVITPLFAEAGDGDGGGGSGADKSGAAFDAAAFKTELLNDINKMVQGALKAQKTDFTKLLQSTGKDKSDTTHDTTTDDTTKDQKSDKTDPEKNALLLEIKKLRTDSEAKFKVLEDQKKESDTKAEKAERESKIRSELGKYQFANDKARDTAFRLFNSEVTRSEDGALIANELPFEKFIETELPSNHAYLLAPKQTDGAGARSGKSVGGKKIDLDTALKPENFSKLTPAEQTEVRQAIANAL